MAKEHVSALAKAQLLSTESAEAASALAQLARADGRGARQVADAGGVPLLVALLDRGAPAGRDAAARALARVAHHATAARDMHGAGAVRPLLEAVRSGSLASRGNGACRRCCAPRVAC